jgi:hypothetical protein
MVAFALLLMERLLVHRIHILPDLALQARSIHLTIARI